MSTAQDVRAKLEPVLVELGLVVEDLSVTPAGKRRLVRVLVDTDISGLDDADTTTTVTPLSLDDVAEATRAVSDVLDTSDVMGAAPYVLEVSSPGRGPTADLPRAAPAPGGSPRRGDAPRRQRHRAARRGAAPTRSCSTCRRRRRSRPAP